jgi:hypothetical protein
MTSEDAPKSETEAKIETVCSFFNSISNLEEPKAARPEEVPVDLIRELLKTSGAKIEISPAGRESLEKKQFRNFQTGRGPGVVEAIGQIRLRHYYAWALEVSKQMEMPKLNRDKSMEEKSRARGLMQFAASVISLAVGLQTAEEFVDEINQRACNGLIAKAKKLGIDPAVIEAGFPGFKRKKKVSSAPPGLLGEAFRRILSEPSGTYWESPEAPIWG